MMIFANAASERRGEGGAVCEYLIIYDGPQPTDDDESIEGF